MQILVNLLMAVGLTLTPVSETGLPELIEDRAGKVVVVNFWATWCAPCREEFPYLVRLHEDWSSEGVSVIPISMDEERDREEALDFLQQQGVSFPTFIRGFQDFEAFVNAIDPQWSGALPATFIFNRQGERVFSRIGKISEEELRREVSSLMESGQ